MPGSVGLKSSDVADPSTATAFTDVNTATVHPGSRNNRKVIDPPGRKAPTRLAVSRTGVPTGPPGEGEARMAATRLRTAIVNVWQAGGKSGLVAQTVVGPNVPAAVGAPARNPCGVRTIPGGRAPRART